MSSKITSSCFSSDGPTSQFLKSGYELRLAWPLTTESELSVCQDIVLLQVIHDIGVQDVLHFFWTDGVEWYWSVIGCCNCVSLLKKGDNMSHCQVSRHSSTVKTWLEHRRQGWSNFCRQLLQKPSRDHVWSSGLVWFEVSSVSRHHLVWRWYLHAGILTGAFIRDVSCVFLCEYRCKLSIQYIGFHISLAVKNTVYIA